MRFSVKGDIKAVTRDLDAVARRIVPRVTISTLNQVAVRQVERPALRATAAAVNVPLGLVRWKHTADGQRTRNPRLLRARATKGQPRVGWRWAGRGGEPGSVGLISFPRRRQTARGVRAGSRTVPGGFIATSRRSGRPVALKRRGKERYPLEVLRVDLTQAADRAFTSRVRTSGGPFRREFERRLAVALKRKRG